MQSPVRETACAYYAAVENRSTRGGVMNSSGTDLCEVSCRFGAYFWICFRSFSTSCCPARFQPVINPPQS
jgi:hypothetical protein